MQCLLGVRKIDVFEDIEYLHYPVGVSVIHIEAISFHELDLLFYFGNFLALCIEKSSQVFEANCHVLQVTRVKIVWIFIYLISAVLRVEPLDSQWRVQWLTM